MAFLSLPQAWKTVLPEVNYKKPGLYPESRDRTITPACFTHANAKVAIIFMYDTLKSGFFYENIIFSDETADG